MDAKILFYEINVWSICSM